MALATRPRLSILVVEEDRDDADILSLLLEFDGHRTAVAYDARRALVVAEDLRPDAVLLDLRLAKCDGLDLCGWFRTRRWARAAPLIIYTGWVRESDLTVARTAGADGYLLKPATPYKLLSALEKLAPSHTSVTASSVRRSSEGATVRQIAVPLRPRPVDVLPLGLREQVGERSGLPLGG